MEAVYLDCFAEKLAQHAAGKFRRVPGHAARRILIMTDISSLDVCSVLIKRAAENDVHRLDSAADSEYWFAETERFAGDVDIEAVAFGVERSLQRARFFAVKERIYVTAAGNNNSVGQRQQTVAHIRVVRGRHGERDASGHRDRSYVGIIENEFFRVIGQIRVPAVESSGYADYRSAVYHVRGLFPYE